ncbi:MAG: L-rhamnose/proton symporter RhaT [Terriglobia bacterium]
MTGTWTSGIIVILLAGFFQGTCMLPLKYTVRWSWENTWLGFSSTAYLIFPWLLALLTVPRLGEILARTSAGEFLRILLIGCGWAGGAITFGLGVDYVGISLSFAVILGLTASLGTLVPLVVRSAAQLATPQGAFILLGVVVMLAGILTCSWAGKLKDTTLRKDHAAPGSAPQKSFALGLLFCILSGLFSPLGNLAFAFCRETTTLAKQLGTPEQYVSIPFWALLTIPMFLCNLAFCVQLFARKHTFAKFLLPASGPYYLLAASMGALWIASMAVYGIGANKLGSIGPSIGWAIYMSSTVVIATLWGLFTGEWRGAGRRALRVMSAGLAVLVVAVFIIGLSNR